MSRPRDNQVRRGSERARRRSRPRSARRKASRRPGGARSLLLRVLAGAMLLLLAFGVALFAWSFSEGQVLGERDEALHVEVTSQDKGAAIDSLARSGMLASPTLTRWYAVWLTPFSDFAPRTHLLSPGMSARQLVERLVEAKSRDRVLVTFPEGWNHRQMAARLQEEHICSELGFQAAVFDEKLRQELSLPGKSVEGYLFPARYEFLVDTDPREVVRRLVLEMRKRLHVLLSRHEPHPDLKRLAFEAHDVVTLASVVQKETSLESESPRVARVFLNRLLAPQGETKGRLQSDPTAAYGCLIEPTRSVACGNYSGQIAPEMLRDEDNPYNTYRYAGLPPGPISNPGETAILAVLAPADGKHLYFVANGRGGHTFSETYEAHQEAISRLRGVKKPVKE